ncbi:MAG: CAP domain-containing protein, partial [Planctomycetota bacterium]
MNTKRPHGVRWFSRACLIAIAFGLVVACGGGGGNGGNTPPPPNPGSNVDPASFDYNLTVINNIRTGRGLTPYVRDAVLDAHAQAATAQLMVDHMPHAYFAATVICNAARAENQGDPNGWLPGLATNTAIDQIIDAMMAEEFMFPPGDPRRGHFEAITSTTYTRIGIGLANDA